MRHLAFITVCKACGSPICDHSDAEYAGLIPASAQVGAEPSGCFCPLNTDETAGGSDSITKTPPLDRPTADTGRGCEGMAAPVRQRAGTGGCDISPQSHASPDFRTHHGEGNIHAAAQH